MSLMEQFCSYAGDKIRDAAMSVWLLPAPSLKTIHSYVEVGAYGAAASYISLRALEPIINALRPDRICDLTSHPYASSLIGAFTGVVLGNHEADDHNARHGVHVGVPTFVGFIAGTATPTPLGFYSGAFVAACLGLCLRRHCPVSERIGLDNNFD